MRRLHRDVTEAYVSSIGVYAMLAGLSPLLVNNGLGACLLVTAFSSGVLRSIVMAEQRGGLLFTMFETVLIGAVSYGLVFGFMQVVLHPM